MNSLCVPAGCFPTDVYLLGRGNLGGEIFREDAPFLHDSVNYVNVAQADAYRPGTAPSRTWRRIAH